VGEKEALTEEPLLTNHAPKQSQKYHLENPYWKTFDPYVIPLLERDMDLRRLEEMDTSAPAKAAAHYHEDALKDASVAEMYKDSE
jgi:hypothetical protein